MIECLAALLLLMPETLETGGVGGGTYAFVEGFDKYSKQLQLMRKER
jgi:hypothetical protein